jgi:hypothetical protein
MCVVTCAWRHRGIAFAQIEWVLGEAPQIDRFDIQVHSFDIVPISVKFRG